MARPDVIVVGSGINGLVCAAQAAIRGRKVLLLEREGDLGGCIKSGEIGAPGFTHDLWAATWVLFLAGPAHAALGKKLEAAGLRFCHPDHPTGVLRPDGSAAVLTRDRAANVAMFDALAEGDGGAHTAAVTAVEANAGLVFPLLGQELWSWSMARLLAREAWRRGPRTLAAYFGTALEPARAWLEADFQSDTSRALWAPWVLHTGLGPESTYSGEMGRVIAFALEAIGAPIVEGGGGRAVAAFRSVIEQAGGEVRTGADVTQIVVRGGEARGVRLADGEDIRAGAVVASVTPTQLYGKLLDRPPPQAAGPARRYRYGKGNFMVHYALSRPPAWRTPGLETVALLHLTDGLDAVSKAANEAERSLLPAVPTVCVGQPSATDPSRAPDGQATLWVQMPEAPRMPKGDAAGEIHGADGTWTPALREAFADRVEGILAQHIDGFRDTVLARQAASPADHEAANINLVGGDPYGGACALDQFFIWRPIRGGANHRTEVKNLWHIGASTHPGPGLGGGSGFLVGSKV